jgi:ATP-dependent HslUV protease ATP-binding subunit HslU
MELGMMGLMGGEPMLPKGMDDLMQRLTEELGPGANAKGPEGREMSVKEAVASLTEEEAFRLINHEQVKQAALDAVETDGIVFVDEVDKLAGGRMETNKGAWSKGEGVQKEL